jgi:SAM-dependent methyltransferase
MKKLLKTINLLFKNYSPLRIYQIIECNNFFLNGQCLEFGASGDLKKNFSSFTRGKSKFHYSNLNNLKNKKIIPLDLTKKLNVKSNQYNNVLIFNVLEHMNDHSIVFKEIKRILKKNGNLLASTPFLYQVHGAPRDYFRFTSEFFLEKLKENGFKKIKIKCLGYGPFVACFSIIHSYIKYLPLITHIVLFMCYLIDFILQLFVKTKLNEIYPIGIFIVAKK